MSELDGALHQKGSRFSQPSTSCEEKRAAIAGFVVNCEECRDKGMAFCSKHGVVKQPRAEKKPAPKSRRRTPIAPESEDMKKLKKRWAFIKACMILSQRRTNGYTSCMSCGAIDPERLDLDHITPAGNGGTWTPDNAQLLCRGPGTNDCHGKKHGQPQWTKREAS